MTAYHYSCLQQQRRKQADWSCTSLRYRQDSHHAFPEISTGYENDGDGGSKPAAEELGCTRDTGGGLKYIISYRSCKRNGMDDPTGQEISFETRESLSWEDQYEIW